MIDLAAEEGKRERKKAHQTKNYHLATLSWSEHLACSLMLPSHMQTVIGCFTELTLDWGGLYSYFHKIHTPGRMCKKLKINSPLIVIVLEIVLFYQPSSLLCMDRILTQVLIKQCLSHWELLKVFIYAPTLDMVRFRLITHFLLVIFWLMRIITHLPQRQK